MLTKTNALQRSTPEAQGIASSAILDFVLALEDKVQQTHSFMLLRHGHVVAEGWWSPYAAQHLHMLFSLSKSFTSTAIGMAVSEGLFNLTDTVLSLFPDEAPDEPSEFLQAMTVHHLLSMSTGQAQDTMEFMWTREDNDWIKGFLSVPVKYEPGTFFLYNTGASYMLSALIQKKTGLKLTEYLRPRLFDPLGIETAIWQLSPQGIETGGFGLSITTDDIARFGQMYLQKGIWQDKRILSEAWIEQATQSQISNGTDPESDWAQGYGYQFWRCRHNVYRGDGAFGQYCIVMPEQDAVLAITGGMPDMQIPLDIVWDILLPAMADAALPENSVSHDTLTEKLHSLRLPTVEGLATSPLGAQFSERTYKLDKNDFRIETIQFNFDTPNPILTIKTASGEHTIPCAYDVWQPGQITLFNEDWQSEPSLIASSGAWSADDCYRVLIQLYETPFCHSFVFHFIEDELLIETRINVSFFSLAPKTLTARSV